MSLGTVLVGVFVLYGLVLSWALRSRGISWSGENPAGDDPVRPARILVIGATGGTGRRLVAEALARGYVVTALVRDPGKVGIEHARLTVLAGDVLDESAVVAAMDGQDAVLSALGHKRFLYPTRILSRGTGNILRAMEARQVPRFVCETSLGIGDSAGRMGLYYTLFVIPLVLPWYFWDKTRQERLIAASGVAWVVVRPGVLTNAPRRGRLRHGRNVGNLVLTPRIARSDVADFMLDQLESNRYVGTAPGVSW